MKYFYGGEIHGEIVSCDEAAAIQGWSELKQLLKDLRDIYNVDKSSVFYNMDPNRSLDIIKDPSGKKKLQNEIDGGTL